MDEVPPAKDDSPRRGRRLWGVSAGSLATAALWAGLFLAMGWVVPQFRAMFEEMDFEFSAFPLSTRIVLAISFLWWVDIAVVPAGAIILKDPFVSERTRRRVNTAAILLMGALVLFIIIALFRPLVSIRC